MAKAVIKPAGLGVTEHLVRAAGTAAGVFTIVGGAFWMAGEALGQGEPYVRQIHLCKAPSICGRQAGWQAKARYGSYLIDPEWEGAIPVRAADEQGLLPDAGIKEGALGPFCR